MAGHAAGVERAGWDGATSPLGTSYGKLFMWFFLISDALTFGGFLCAYGFYRHKFAEQWADPGEVFTHFPGTHEHIPLAYVGLMTFILIMSSVTMVLAVEAGHRLKRRPVLIWMFLTIIGGFTFLGSQAWEWYNFIKGTDNGCYILQADFAGYKKGDVAQYASTKTVDANQFGPLAISGVRIGDDKSKMIIEACRTAEKEGTTETAPVVRFQGANLKHNEYGHALFGDFFFFITGFHGFHVFSGVIINIVIFIMAFMGVFERRGHYEMVEKTGLYWHFVDLVWVFVFTFFYLL